MLRILQQARHPALLAQPTLRVSDEKSCRRNCGLRHVPRRAIQHARPWPVSKPWRSPPRLGLNGGSKHVMAEGAVSHTTLLRVATYETGTAHMGAVNAVFLLFDRGLKTQAGFVISPNDARRLGQFLLEEADRCEAEGPSSKSQS